nr:uncharacterized protein I203_08080 [Kwoniella mangroviensis CBS 8507]OCF62856.1 hypothetical protein I203_08080 [Kwoniella mangroviensis CBS 8507]
MSAIRDSVKIDSVLSKILKIQGWRRPKNLGDYLYGTRIPQVAADRPVRSRSRPLQIVTTAVSKGSTEHVIRELNEIKQGKITFIFGSGNGKHFLFALPKKTEKTSHITGGGTKTGYRRYYDE